MVFLWKVAAIVVLGIIFLWIFYLPKENKKKESK